MSTELPKRRGRRIILLLFAIILTLALPIDLLRTWDAWSWESRKVRITTSRIESGGIGKRRWSSLRVDLRDLADGKDIQHVRLGFGHQAPPTGPLSYFGGPSPAAYPVGKEIIAYRNPTNHDEYILEQRGLSWFVIALLTASIGWIGWNIRLAVKHRRGEAARQCAGSAAD